MKNGFIQNDEKRIRKRLNKTSFEFYQHPEFVNLDANLIGGQPLPWYFEDGNNWMLIPLIKRKIPDEITNNKEYYDLISPYGYPGILSDSYDTTIRFLNKFKRDATNEGYISTFIRLSPFYNPFLLNETDDLVQVVHGKLVLLDLNQSYDKKRMGYSSSHRRDVKKLVKSGYTLEWDRWDKLDLFIEIYSETMKREDATAYYFFPKTYYQKLKEILGEENIDLVFVKNEDGEDVAAGIFCKNDHIIQYHLGATKTDYLSVSPSKLLFDGIVKKYSGKVDYFNLGGGVGNKQDSLFRFKERFGKEYRKFTTFRIVNDRQRYNNLCREYPKEELYNLKGYFPLYRK